MNETIDLLARANSVCWCGHVLRRVDGHVLTRALVLRMKGRPKRTWKKQVVEHWFEKGRCICGVLALIRLLLG